MGTHFTTDASEEHKTNGCVYIKEYVAIRREPIRVKDIVPGKINEKVDGRLKKKGGKKKSGVKSSKTQTT